MKVQTPTVTEAFFAQNSSDWMQTLLVAGVMGAYGAASGAISLHVLHIPPLLTRAFVLCAPQPAVCSLGT